MIGRAINTLRHLWGEGLCSSWIRMFNFLLLLREEKSELNFPNLNIALVSCRSNRNCFPSPLHLIRERDSVITDINATQKHLGTCEARKYKMPPKGSLMSSQIVGFAKTSGRKRDPPDKQTVLISSFFCNLTLFL